MTTTLPSLSSCKRPSPTRPSPGAWTPRALIRTTFDLSVKNPNGGEEIAHRSPEAIMDEIAALDAESAEVLGNIKALL